MKHYNFEDFNELKDWLHPHHEDEMDLGYKILLGSGLYGTILTDAYKKNEAPEIHKALKKLCGEDDLHPFDIYGIYVYWHFESKEILYIGLTKNLVTRFVQHNSNSDKIAKGNKSVQIHDYFQKFDKIGFSILLQPPLIPEPQSLFQFDKPTEVKIIEGSLFQTFINEYGRLPIWNQIEGNKTGRKEELVKRYGDILGMLNLKEPGYLNANSTIKELAENIEFQRFECDLNLIRAYMYQYKEPFEDIVARIINWNHFLASKGNIEAISSNIRIMKLLDSHYLQKELKAL